MKIKSIVLYNVGPYVNKNVFDFSIDQKGKNIVLIGGKNGAGKTTFFNSIKTCLYGSKVFGFDAPGKEYFVKIDKLVNKRLQYDNSNRAFVELEMDFNNGKDDNRYLLHREWRKFSKSYEEDYFVLKNGIKLGDDEQVDFTNYILSTIPPDMFNFYFFDGESIADYFLGNEGGKNFRNAFLKLYGLDTLSIMVENFVRYCRRADGKTSAYDMYVQSKAALEEEEVKIENIKEEFKRLEEKIDLGTIQLCSLQNEYEKNGGVSISEWKNISSEILKEEAKREEINRWIKEIANNYIPFIILHKQMKDLAETLEQESIVQRNEIINNVIQDEQFEKGLSDLLVSSRAKNIDSKDIISYISSQLGLTDKQNKLLDFSIQQSNRIIAQINEKNSFDTKVVSVRLKDLDKSLARSKRLRDKLVASSIDGFEEYTQDRNKIEQEIAALHLDEEKMKQQIELRESELSLAKVTFKKSKDSYELLLKKKSIGELSSRAIATYSLLEDSLIKQQSKKLEQEFINCFSAIINKDNFLDGIVIDKNISIIPYKLVDISYSQIDNYIIQTKQSNFLDLFENKYWKEINDLRMGNVESIKLPSPITAPFSQGERQVFIMSLYLALLKTSKKDLPFFIDTPFSRIDSNHRERIIQEFFLGINNQMFVLSTDEEFVGQYKKMISSHISDMFVLSIDGYGKSNVVKGKYFEV
jgi:DNA sulfur modification protein DndD